MLNRFHNTLLIAFSCLFFRYIWPHQSWKGVRWTERRTEISSLLRMFRWFFFSGCFLFGFFVLWCLEIASICGVRGVLIMPLPLPLGISYLYLKLLWRPQKNLTSTLEPSGFVALRLNIYRWQRVFIWTLFQSSAGMMKCMKWGFWVFSLV